MSSQHEPIHSTLEDDCERYESISDFVIGLAEQVDSLQDAESSGDLALLDELARELGRQACEYGYACLSDQTERIRGACANDKPELAQAALVELTELSRRIRLGHRGAA